METDDLRELTSLLRPYMDLMAWDVRALSENRYDETIAEIRVALGQMHAAGDDQRGEPGG